VLEPFDHERMAIERRYSQEVLSAAYDAYVQQREAFLEWLKARDEADWQRVGVHPEAGEYTLLEQAMQAPLHDVDHLEQIARVLGLPGAAGTPPLALL